MSRFVHYKWLEVHLPKFLDDVGVVGGWDCNAGIISAHGDKFYGYRDHFKRNGLHFAHGVAIGLLTYCAPFGREVRQQPTGWVPVDTWITDNADRFLHLLPEVDETDPRYCSLF